MIDNLLLKKENEIDIIFLQPHLGLISLIAVLENAGHSCTLYDPKIEISRGTLKKDKSLYKNIARRILEYDPDLIGLTSLGCNFICTVKIAAYLKEFNPSVPILLGGPHATVLHTEIMNAFKQFDIIVRNEAESKIIPVINALNGDGLDAIPGISFRKDNLVISTAGDSSIENLDDLPVAAYRAYPIQSLNLNSLRVEAGRGCPFRCTFCSTATYFGRRYRLKSAGNLCRELDYLHVTYGISDFSLTHDLFTVNRHKVIEFCNEVRPRKYTWSCSARVDCVDEELLKTMKEAGCRGIYYGIETGSKRMQEITKKKLDLDLFHPILEKTIETGITPTISFITGYPEETKKDQDDTLDILGSCYLRKYELDVKMQLHLLTPEPGTALMNQYGHLLAYDNYVTDFNFPTLEEDDASMMEQLPAIFMNHHYFKSVLPREQHIFVTSFFEIMHPLGKPIIAALIRRYANKLHRLCDAVQHWMKINYPGKKACTIEAFTRFTAAAFGKGSYLYSLVRYTYKIHTLNVEIDKEKKRPRIKDKRKKTITLPNTHFFKKIHNVPGIMETLEKAGSVTRKLASEKTNLLTQIITDASGSRKVKNFEVDSDISELLKMISTSSDTSAFSTSITYLKKAGLVCSC